MLLGSLMLQALQQLQHLMPRLQALQEDSDGFADVDPADVFASAVAVMLQVLPQARTTSSFWQQCLGLEDQTNSSSEGASKTYSGQSCTPAGMKSLDCSPLMARWMPSTCTLHCLLAGRHRLRHHVHWFVTVPGMPCVAEQDIASYSCKPPAFNHSSAMACRWPALAPGSRRAGRGSTNLALPQGNGTRGRDGPVRSNGSLQQGCPAMS